MLRFSQNLTTCPCLAILSLSLSTLSLSLSLLSLSLSLSLISSIKHLSTDCRTETKYGDFHDGNIGRVKQSITVTRFSNSHRLSCWTVKHCHIFKMMYVPTPTPFSAVGYFRFFTTEERKTFGSCRIGYFCHTCRPCS